MRKDTIQKIKETTVSQLQVYDYQGLAYEPLPPLSSIGSKNPNTIIIKRKCLCQKSITSNRGPKVVKGKQCPQGTTSLDCLALGAKKAFTQAAMH